MELRHLKYFVTVAEELHFGKAAKRLMMSQPPLSQQIKSLENELGVLLFYRTKRQCELTKAGEFFLSEAYKILNSVSQAKEEVQRIHRGESGRIVLGFTGGFALNLLPKILRAFKKGYPNANFALRHLSTSDQEKYLLDGTLHVGLVVPPIESQLLNLKVLQKETFIAALPASHPLAKNREPIDLSSLVNEPFIMTPRHVGPGFYDTVISMCHHAGFSPKVQQEAHEFPSVVSLVASGLGVALLPSSIEFFHNNKVVYQKLKGGYSAYQMAVAWNEENYPPIVESFIEMAKRFDTQTF